MVKNKRVRLFLLIPVVGIILLYLLTTLIPFLHPGKYWFVAVLGLGFPFLLLAVFISLLITAILRSKYFFVLLAVLLSGWQQITALIAPRFSNSFDLVKNENTLRVLSWNVSSWSENPYIVERQDEVSLRSLMMDLIQMHNADVLCLQEYYESYAPEVAAPNMPALKKMGFIYHYFSPLPKTRDRHIKAGLSIFSKYPIADTGYHRPAHFVNGEGYSFADISFNGDTIRIFNTHLESPKIARWEYNPLDNASESRSVAGKIKNTYVLRSEQAVTLRSALDSSKIPAIVCGDFNDIPNSYTYFKIKGDLQDVFLEKGSWFGRTFRFISPTLRIDYILADKRFKIEQYSKPENDYSDHFPQIVDVSLSR